MFFVSSEALALNYFWVSGVRASGWLVPPVAYPILGLQA